MSQFIDYVKFYASSGHGGAGSVHFRREKHVPKGGPDGGNGGNGGQIILKGNKQLQTLLHLKYKKHIKAQNGIPGQRNNRAGAHGKNVILEVPPGTIAKEAHHSKIIFEILEHGEERVLLEGGIGGKGNAYFKSPTDRTPRHAQPGKEGREAIIILELKLLADVGLVGFPNAGKSTLLSKITAAKPKIADYPFTTLTPNLGIIAYHEFESFVMADIPGILEGAAAGIGLGNRFLRHIERNAILLIIISADTKNIYQEWVILQNELKKHNPELIKKKQLVAISKCDLPINEVMLKDSLKKMKQINPIFISSFNGRGIQKLKDEIWKHLPKLP